MFSPWYSWTIAELALNNNHSLTDSHCTWNLKQKRLFIDGAKKYNGKFKISMENKYIIFLSYNSLWAHGNYIVRTRGATVPKHEVLIDVLS